MTLIIHIGRRVPKNWARRQLTKLGGLISFQENIWLMIKQSMRINKKKANSESKNMNSRMYNCKFVMETDMESEDMTFNLEWIKITFQGTEAQEQEEYNEMMGMYNSLGKVLKKEYPKDEKLSKHLKTKILTLEQVKKAYEAGHTNLSENNLVKTLNEMGILVFHEWNKDWGNRE